MHFLIPMETDERLRCLIILVRDLAKMQAVKDALLKAIKGMQHITIPVINSKCDNQ